MCGAGSAARAGLHACCVVAPPRSLARSLPAGPFVAAPAPPPPSSHPEFEQRLADEGIKVGLRNPKGGPCRRQHPPAAPPGHACAPCGPLHVRRLPCTAEGACLSRPAQHTLPSCASCRLPSCHRWCPAGASKWTERRRAAAARCEQPLKRQVAVNSPPSLAAVGSLAKESRSLCLASPALPLLRVFSVFFLLCSFPCSASGPRVTKELQAPCNGTQFNLSPSWLGRGPLVAGRCRIGRRRGAQSHNIPIWDNSERREH